MSRIEGGDGLDPVLRSELDHARDRPVWREAQQLLQILLRVQPVKRRRGDEGAERRVPAEARLVGEPLPVVPAEDEIPELRLRDIVVQAKAPIVEKSVQGTALVLVVANRLVKRPAWIDLLTLPRDPLVEDRQHRAGSRGPRS